MLALEVLAGAWLAIVTHELGHWIGAKICGFTCRECRIGPLRWNIKDGWKIETIFSYYSTAHVAIAPTKPLPRLRLRYGVIVLFGPLTNLIAGIATAYFFESRHPSLFVETYCLTSLLACTSLIPRKPDKRLSQGSDGYQIKELLFNRGYTARLKFMAEYRERIVSISSSLKEQNWLAAHELADSLLKEIPNDPLCNKMEMALRKILDLSQRGIHAREAALVPGDPL